MPEQTVQPDAPMPEPSEAERPAAVVPLADEPVVVVSKPETPAMEDPLVISSEPETPAMEGSIVISSEPETPAKEESIVISSEPEVPSFGSSIVISSGSEEPTFEDSVQEEPTREPSIPDEAVPEPPVVSVPDPVEPVVPQQPEVEPKEDVPTEKPVEEEKPSRATRDEERSHTPIAPIPHPEKTPWQRYHSWMFGLLFVIGAIICFVIGYGMGYTAGEKEAKPTNQFNLVPVSSHIEAEEDEAETPKEEPANTDAAESQKSETPAAKQQEPAAKQTTPATPAVKTEMPEPQRNATPQSQAKKFEQVQGGAYLIVGTKGTHVMKSGDQLNKLAIQVYGNKDYVPYIVVHNQFEDPDNIPLGYEVKLPELVKRE
ncbi:MAG: hypothetical protein HUK03_00055, partial [Bacteroidaceae bacterium]|nr:hypothetical protein [Bacteroidaceae bacterium]